MNEHIVSSYDEDIKDLQEQVVAMGGLVEKIWMDAMECVKNANDKAALQVIESDKKIDSMELKIYDKSMRLLALRSPLASDLRIVVSAMRMASSLERLGDHAKNIARREKLISTGDHPEIISLLTRMYDLSHSALQQAINAYRNSNPGSAEEIRANDARVDELFDSTVAIVLNLMAPKNPPLETEALASLLFIAKSLERMGDMTTNIAEIIIFQETGSFPTDERPRGKDHQGGLMESLAEKEKDI